MSDIDSFADSINAVDIDIESINKLLTRLASNHHLPADIVECEEFRDFVGFLNPVYLPHMPTAEDLRNRLNAINADVDSVN